MTSIDKGTFYNQFMASFRRTDPPRTYLGASSLGVECERAAWLAYRGCAVPDFSDRMEKLLDHGHSEEARHAKAIRKSGYKITGDQIPLSAFNGLMRGHTDGFIQFSGTLPQRSNDEWELVLVDEWVLWEMKTSSHKRFQEVSNHGVQKKKPQHYAQMQIYMGLYGRGIKRAVYMMTDKDTDEIHVELVDFCQSTFDELMSRAKRILTESIPSKPKNAKTPDCFFCKWCDAQTVCWADTKAPTQCGTCDHWVIDIEAGKTKCKRTGETKTQFDGCDLHEMMAEFATDDEAMIFFTE
jgi:hypothetical protein